MQTYLLSDDDVARYASDFLARLELLGSRQAMVWVSLGLSGDRFVDVLDSLLEGQGKDLPEIAMLTVDRLSGEVIFRNDDSLGMIERAVATGSPVVLLDSAVHSGRTMRRVAKLLFDKGVSEVVSYSLIIKQTSEFVPTFFGLMIGESDRAFFQLQMIPNHRLTIRKPVGILRALDQGDVDKGFVNTESPSVNQKTFGDLFYLAHTQHFRVYVYEVGSRIVGVLAFTMLANRSLFVDLIARDKEFKDARIGGMLLRWAETYARHNGCLAITLMSISEAIPAYKRYEFEAGVGNQIDVGGGEVNVPLSKRILYNIKWDQQIELSHYG